MPKAGLLTGTQERSYGGLPTLPLVNLIAERAITEPTQFALMSRPGLQKYLSSALGSAVPIRALFYDTSINTNGGFFAVFSTTFYDNADDESVTLNGSLLPSLAGNEIGIVGAAGSTAKWWDGTVFRTISFPDGANVTKVIEHEGRFIFLRALTQRYYWTEPLTNMLDGSGNMVIDGLAYASAENEPDQLVDALIFQDHLVLGGVNTIELHGVSGNANAPYAPALGSTIHKGVFGTGAMALFDGSFAWVLPNRGIYKYDGSGGQRISNAGIEDKLRFFTGIALDSFFFEGREFLHVYEISNGAPVIGGHADFLLDATTGEWCEWETDGNAFDGGPSVDIGQNYPIFGAKTDSRVLGLATHAVLPGGGWETTPEKRFRFGIPVDGGVTTIHNVLLRCQTYTSGTATASLRFSRDKGNTWSAYRDRSLVASGIRNKIEWRSLGMADHPGFLCEVKTANCDEFSVSGAMFNEFVQGRSR